MNDKSNKFDIRHVLRNKDQAQRMFQVCPEVILSALTLDGNSWQWWFCQVAKRGDTRKTAIGNLGDPRQVERSVPAAMYDSQPLKAALFSLVSITREPSAYGTTRAELEDLRTTGNVKGILRLIPIGQKIGKSKVMLASEDERGEAIELLERWEFGASLILALTTPQDDGSRVSLWLPGDIYHRLRSEATACLLSPGQYIVQILRERYN